MVRFLGLTQVTESPHVTYEVSFIPYVEIQLTNVLYNSVIGYDLLNGNTYV